MWTLRKLHAKVREQVKVCVFIPAHGLGQSKAQIQAGRRMNLEQPCQEGLVRID